MKQLFGCLGLLAGLLALGCGGDSNGIASEEDAAAGFALIAKQTILAGSDIDADSNGPNGSTTLECVDGGTLDSSVATTKDEAAGSANATANHDFHGCALEGSTLTGKLTQTGEQSQSGDTTTTMSKIKGTVTFSGNIDGVCEIDASITTTRAGSGKPSSEVSGTICDFPASDIYALL